MSVVFRENGFRFPLYANAGTAREPQHTHVLRDGIDAKFWLWPEVTPAYNDGFNARVLRGLAETIEPNRDEIARAWDESSSVRAKAVRFDQDSMWIELSDGRTLGVPLAWFPRLLHGSIDQREQVTISSRGLHWEALDEDISIEGLLAGRGDQTRSRAAVQAA